MNLAKNLFCSVAIALVFGTAWASPGPTDYPVATTSVERAELARILESEDFSAKTYEEQLAILDRFAPATAQATPDLLWARGTLRRLVILVSQGNIKEADALVDALYEPMAGLLADTEYYARLLYATGFVKLYSEDIGATLAMMEKIQRIEDFDENILYQQYANTLLVALHTRTGNAIMAGEVLVAASESPHFTELPEYERLKLLSNIGYAMMSGEDIERAVLYIGKTDDLRKTFLAEGKITDSESKLVIRHVTSNLAQILVNQERYGELQPVISRMTSVSDDLASPLFFGALKYAEAAVEFDQGAIGEAKKLIAEAVEIITPLGADDVTMNALSLQAKILADSGDPAGALEAYIAKQSLFESTQAQQTLARSEYLIARANLTRQNEEIARLEDENAVSQSLRKREQLITAIALVALITVFLFSGNLLSSRRRLRSYADDLEKSEKLAQAAVEAKSAFLANMSHEIRTPLNGLLGMAQALQGSKQSAKDAEQLDVLLNCGESLLKIVNDILDLSKIEAGKMVIDPAPSQTVPLLEETIKLWAPKADEKGIQLSLSVQGDIPAWATFDASRLRQCVSNLISNAIKFTNKGGVFLEAEYQPQSKRLIVSVRDTGVGIPQDVVDRLFTPFEQGDKSTTRKFGGTGLGLAISQQLATAMGGDIKVNSSKGVGSVFTLSIAAPECDSNETSPPTTLVRPSENNHDLSSLKALLVDDNAVNRMVVKAFLGELGCEIIEAEHGQQALQTLNAQGTDIDLVLLDMHMPVMDGPETINNIRRSDADWSETPIIILTADAMEGDRVRYLNLGAEDYVTKPIIKQKLFDAVIRVTSDPSEERLSA